MEERRERQKNSETLKESDAREELSATEMSKESDSREELSAPGTMKEADEKAALTETELLQKEEKKNKQVTEFPDGKHQNGLFDIREKLEDTNISQLSINLRSKTFINPNPNLMFIGKVHISEYLQEVGLDWVIRLREFVHNLDWTDFVKEYKGGGNSSYHPKLMFSLIIFGIMKGVNSLRCLEELSRESIGCMWMCNGIMPDFTTIGRFIKKHKEILTEGYFEEITKRILKIVGIKVTSVGGDGTVVQAASSSYKKLKLEALKEMSSEAERKSEESPEDDDLRKKSEQLKKAETIVEERAQKRKASGNDGERTFINPNEPEACLQPLKNKAQALSYVTSILTTKERIIVGKDVDPSNEIKLVKEMLAQASRVGNSRIEELMLDARYFTDEIVKLSEELGINLLCPEGKSFAGEAWERKSNKRFQKNRFVYDKSRDVLICPQGKLLHFYYSYCGDAKNKGYRRYRCVDCVGCPVKTKCTKLKYRTVKRFTLDEQKDVLREKMRLPENREKYKMRKSSTEPVFAETKGIQGFIRFLRKGLENAKLEHSLHCIAHNIRRMFAIARRVPELANSLKSLGSRSFLNIILTLLYILLLKSFIFVNNRQKSIHLQYL